MNVEKLNERYLRYVFENMREDNRSEMVANNISEAEFMSYLETTIEGVAICNDEDIAFGVFGAEKIDGFPYTPLWGVFTDEVNKHWYSATKFARYWCKTLRAMHGKPLAISMWMKRTHAIEWFKLVGFVDSGHRSNYRNEEFMLMEFK